MLGLQTSSAPAFDALPSLMPHSVAQMAAPAPLAPVTVAPVTVAPALLFVLCLIAAIGVILLLPGRREATLRKIGGAVLLAAGVVFAAVLARTAGGMGAYFWIFSGIALFCAVRVITHSRPVYSALYFVMTVMASAGLFVLMWAEFMAAALVLIYAGAILVTYVFVIMLAAQSQSPGAEGGQPMHEQLAEHDAISREPILASAVGFALLGIILFVIFDRSTVQLREHAASGQTVTLAAAVTPPATMPVAQTFNPGIKPATQPARGFVPRGQTQALGTYLFSSQLVNLELAGLILTVAMVGAIVIARKRVIGGESDVRRDASGAVLIAPMTPIDDNPHSIPVYGTDNPRQKEYPET